MKSLPIFLSILSLFLIGGFLQAAPEPSPDELRTKARALVAEQEKKEKSDKYTLVNKEEVIIPYKQAAEIYEKLLLTIDDAESGNDLKEFLAVGKKAYAFSPPVKNGLPENYPLNIISKSRAKHPDNLSYLITLWRESGRSSGSGWFGPEIENRYKDTYFPRDLYQFHRLKLGEQIIKLNPEETLKKDYGLFLLQYIKSYLDYVPNYQDWSLSSDMSDAVLDKKWEIPVFSEDKPQGRLLAENDSIIVYPPATSWDAAKTIGERIEFLFREALAYDPGLDACLRMVRATYLGENFSPFLGTSYEKVNNKEQLSTFASYLENLAENQTIIFHDGKWVTLDLPVSLQYVGQFKSLAHGELNFSDTESQKDLDKVRVDSSINLMRELVMRLSYEEALEEAGKLLMSLQEIQGFDTSYQRMILEGLVQQLSGNWIFLPSVETKDFFNNQPPFEMQNRFRDFLDKYIDDYCKAIQLFSSPADIKIPILYRNASRINISLYRLKTDYLQKDAIERSRQKANRYSVFINTFVDTDNQFLGDIQDIHRDPAAFSEILYPPVQAQYVLTPVRGHRDTFDYLKLPELESGIYLVEAVPDGEGKPAFTWIEVSGIDVTSYSSQTGLDLFICDRTTGEPRKNASVDIVQFRSVKDISRDHDRTQDDQKIEANSFTMETDEKGLIHIPLAKENYGSEMEEGFIFSIQSGKDKGYHVVRPENYSKKTHREKISAFITTDRPSYRPGQTLYWSAWVGKTDIMKGGSVLKNTRVKVDFGKLAASYEGTTDENGMIGGSLVIPDMAALDNYALNVYLFDEEREGNKDSASGNATPKTSQIIGTARIAIEDYKKQEYFVSLETDKDIYTFGQPGKVTVKASYYSGQPVAGGKVDFHLERGSFYPGEFSDSEQAPPLKMQRTVSLDDKGMAVIDFNLPFFPLSTDADKQLQNTYIVRATVTDASLRQILEEKNFQVVNYPNKVSLDLDQSYGRAGEGISGKVAFQTVNNEPVSMQGEALLTRITKKNDKEKEEKILSWNITTNTQGESSLRFTPPTGGKYKLEIRFPIDSAKSDYVTETRTFYVVSKNGEKASDAQDFPWQTDVEAILEKDIYPKDVKARLLLVTPEKLKSLLLVKAAGYEDEEKHIIPLTPPFTEFELNVTQNNAPGFNIDLVYFENSFAKSCSVYVRVEEKEQRLILTSSLAEEGNTSSGTGKSDASSVEVSNEPQKIPVYEPGDKTDLQVNVTRRDGGPVSKTPVIITVYDKALEAFHHSYWVKDIQKSFHDFPGRNSHLLPETNFNDRLPPTYQNTPHTLEFITEDPADEMDLLMGNIVAYTYTFENSPLSDHALLPLEGLTRNTNSDKKRVLSVHPYSRKKNYLLTMPFTSTADFAPPLRRAKYETFDMAVFGERPLSEVHEAENQNHSSEATPLRSEFSDLLKWSGTLITDENGIVSLPLTMPDNLTTWKVRAWSVDKDLYSGSLEAEFITSQNLIAQLQTPRFLVEKDTSTLSAVIRNNTETEEEVEVSLSSEGGYLEIISGNTPPTQIVTVPAKGIVTVDWDVAAHREGTAPLVLTARGKTLGDASTQTLPLIVRGAYAGESFSGIITPGQNSLSGNLTLPQNIRPELSQLDLSITPGVAPVIVHALPYLNDYPYGCVEQVLNRFIPSCIAFKTFSELGIDPVKIVVSLDGRQQTNPLKDTAQLQKTIRTGLSKLEAARNRDGGWSWFPGGGASSPYITAQVVHGLLMLRDTEWDFDKGAWEEMILKGLDFLQNHEEKRLEALTRPKERKKADHEDVFVHSVLFESGYPERRNTRMTDALYKDRHQFTPYILSKLALILHHQGKKTQRDDIAKALKKVVASDKKTGTFWLNLPQKRLWWNWEHDHIEAQAAYLQFLCAVSPKDELTRGLARWIAANREHSYYWKSTRDTAMAIESLCTYLRASSEGTKPLSLEVLLNDKTVAGIQYDPSKLDEFQGGLSIDPALLLPGVLNLQVKRTDGDTATPVYIGARLKYFSLEEPLKATGSDLKITRSLARIAQNADQNTQQENPLLKDGEHLSSGDLLEVSLTIEAENDYQFIMIRDPKAAGCEPYHLISGYHSVSPNGGTSLLRFPSSYYTELADRETRIFIPSLPRGSHTITYKLRVERPGTYTALPAQVEAMYTPVLHGNSDENILHIEPPSPIKPVADAKKDVSGKETGLGDETSREAFEMAFRIRMGWGYEINYPLAIRWIKKASSDYVPALVAQGWWILQQTSNPDRRQETASVFREALALAPSQLNSEDGDVLSAIASLYLMDDSAWKYFFEETGPAIKNRRQEGINLIKKAIALYDQKAAEGSGYAAYRIGKLYSGEGIQDSPVKALEYYEMSAATGFAPALYEAAKLLPDGEKSEDYLFRAVNTKLYPAAELLAERLFMRRNAEGALDPEMIAQALVYLQMAAEGGCPQSQLSLAWLYEKGLYLGKDIEKAQFWRSKAGDGHFYSNSPLDELDLPIIDAIKGRHLPDEDILPLLGGSIPNIPLPDSLPHRDKRWDAMTEGELIDAWEKGENDAASELAERFAAMDDPIGTIEESLQDYVTDTVIKLNTLAREGNTKAALDLAEILIESGFPQDRQLGFQWLNLLANENHAQAIQILAVEALLSQSPEEGVSLLTKLARRNDLNSILELRDIFQNSGRGAELNLARASAYQAQYADIHNLEKLLKLVQRDLKKKDISIDALNTIAQHIITAAETETQTPSTVEAGARRILNTGSSARKTTRSRRNNLYPGEWLQEKRQLLQKAALKKILRTLTRPIDNV